MSDIKELIASKLRPIANAIRNKKGTVAKINAQNFASEIESIEPIYGTLEIVEPGEHDVKDYKKALVNIVSSDADTLINLIERKTKTDIIVPYGTTQIGKNGLYALNFGDYIQCQNYKLEIPITVEKFETDSLAGTGSQNYFPIHYKGTLEQWIDIPKGEVCLEDEDYRFTKSYIVLYINDVIVKEIVVPNNITELKYGALGSLVVDKIYIPKNVVTLGNHVFTRCGRKLYQISDGVQIEFEDGSYFQQLPTHFLSDSVIASLKLPLFEIAGYDAFSNITCNEVVIPEGCKTIEYSCFYGAQINYLELPSTLTEIKSLGLKIKSGLTLTMKGSTPPTITNDYKASQFKVIYVPVGSRETYINATNWSALASKILEPNVVTLSVPSELLNNENFTFSIDGGETWNQFSSESITLSTITVMDFKSTDANTTVLIGTSEGGSDVGTIANATLKYPTLSNVNIYLTIQE